MEFQRAEALLARRIGDRVAAPLAVLQQKVRVLAGNELEVRIGGKLDAEDGDIGRGLVEPLDAGRENLRPDAVQPGELAHLDRQVGQRLRLAEQRVALGLVVLRKVAWAHVTVVHASFLDRAAAGAAHAFAAAIGQLVAGVEPRLEHGLALRYFKAVAARLQRDAVSHRRALITPWNGLALPPRIGVYCPYANSLALVQCVSASAAASNRSTPASGSWRRWSAPTDRSP